MGGGKDGINAASSRSISIDFYYKGVRCRERIKLSPTPRNIRYVENLRGQIFAEIEKGTFDYANYFPQSKRAKLLSKQPSALVTVASKLEAWLDGCRANIEHSTYIGYERAIRNTLSPAFGSIMLRDLSRATIRAWASTQKTTAKRINNVLTPLRQMLAEALSDGVIASNPCHGITIKRKGVREDDIDPFSPDEVTAILSQCDSGFRNLIQFAFWTGLRTSELIALRWQDIDWKRGLVLVRQALVRGQFKGPKTAAGRREVKLLPPALDALKSQKSLTLLQKNFIFLDPRTGKHWAGDKPIREWHWRPALQRAGVRYRYPYQTRHTYASTLLSAGENPVWVASQMGHRDWVMIVRTYGRWIPQVDPNAGEKAASVWSTFGQHDDENACFN